MNIIYALFCLGMVPPFIPPPFPGAPPVLGQFSIPPPHRPLIASPPPHSPPSTFISRPPQLMSMNQQQQQQSKYPTLIDKKTTVFVDKISPALEDDFVQRLLRTCGPFEAWRRLKDDKTKIWKPFGFCEYASVESAMLALQIINGMKLEGSALELKSDTKSKQFMEDYKQQKLELIAKSRLGPSFDSDKPVQVTEADRNRYDQEYQAKVVQTRRLIDQLFSEQEHVKVELETRQSISEEIAVQNTIEKIAATGATEEETETKRVIIADQIRKFRESEKKRERERLERVEREKRARQEEERYHKNDGYYHHRGRYSPVQNREYERDYKRRRYDNHNDVHSHHQKRYENRSPPPAVPHHYEQQQQSPPTSTQLERHDPQHYQSFSSSSTLPPTLNIEEKPLTINLQPIVLQTKPREQSQKPTEAVALNVFDHDEGEEEEDSLYSRRSKLTTLDEIEQYTQKEEEQKKRKDEELRRRMAEIEKKRKAANTIPDDKTKLFAYPVDWGIVDKQNIVSKLRDYVNQLIADLIGSEEVSMAQFILGKIELHSTPQDLLSDIQDVLGEEDAESFVVKLWKRLLTEVSYYT
jgi:RNA recognition motif-containing protein